MVGYVTASLNDKRIFDECPNIMQKRVRDPSFCIGFPVTVIAVGLLGLTTGKASPSDQDFHNSCPLQALAVVSPGVIWK